MVACAMVCAICTEITFCVSRSCESAVIENALRNTNVAIANTEKRMWDIEFSSKHRRCDESRILQAFANPSQRRFVNSISLEICGVPVEKSSMIRPDDLGGSAAL